MDPHTHGFSPPPPCGSTKTNKIMPQTRTTAPSKAQDLSGNRGIFPSVILPVLYVSYQRKGNFPEPKKLKKSENFYPGCRARFTFEDFCNFYDNERACREGRVLLVDLCLHFIVFLAACFDVRHAFDLVTALKSTRSPEIERNSGVDPQVGERLVHEIVHNPDRIIFRQAESNPEGDYIRSPSFVAVATGKTFIFPNASFISAVNFTMVPSPMLIQESLCIYFSVEKPVPCIILLFRLLGKFTRG